MNYPLLVFVWNSAEIGERSRLDESPIVEQQLERETTEIVIVEEGVVKELGRADVKGAIEGKGKTLLPMLIDAAAARVLGLADQSVIAKGHRVPVHVGGRDPIVDSRRLEKGVS